MALRKYSLTRRLTRRAFIRSAASACLIPAAKKAPAVTASRKATDIRIEEISFSYEDHLYRAPYKFGGRSVDRVTLLNVRCVARSRDNRAAIGFGSMPLGNIWSFPSKVMGYDATLGAMKSLAEQINRITGSYREYGHPFDINHALEPLYLRAAEEVSSRLKLAEPVPKLCTLVTASPFDAAIHDAFGKILGRSCYQTYGPDLVTHDLSHYLGPDFKGEFVDRYVAAKPAPRTFIYHSIGALDPVVERDIKRRIGDGLPETLPEWIRYNGLSHFKIKLNGDNSEWDIDRVVEIDRAVERAQSERGVREWKYLLDFNENCANVGYLLDVLRAIKDKTPGGFNRIQYIEQPTARNLKANRSNLMHEAARLRPVVIDESLTDLETLMLARQMGYTGVALKACKGQSQAMLMAAAARKYNMSLCVQDLTCPGASFIHSAGLAAHVPGVAAIEANARQYVPSANRGWAERFPGLFEIREGVMNTSVLAGPGLGAGV